MQFGFDRPRDRWVTERIELLSGWVSDKDPIPELTGACGDVEIPVRKCVHPWAFPVPPATHACGFYAYLILQDLLPYVQKGMLQISFYGHGKRCGSLFLRVSPFALECATHYPVNRKTYSVRFRQPFPEETEKPRTLVFPGLGAVGGMSLQQLFRIKMYQHGWMFPVYDEANEPERWAKACVSTLPSMRWIDGHGCYRAAAYLTHPCARICMLREPMRRLVSIFNYMSIVHPLEFPYATFEDFLNSDEPRLYSQPVRLLRFAGVEVAGTISDATLYEMAKQELDQNYRLVGITERFEESILLICRLGGYEDIGMWWRVLSAPACQEVSDLSGYAIRRMKDLLSVDCRLYEEKLKQMEILVEEADFGQSLVEYKNDSLALREFTNLLKMAECMRWRQVLADRENSRLATELAAMRAQSDPIELAIGKQKIGLHGIEV